MKTILPAFFLGLALSSAFAAAAPVTSSIAAVTVYTDRAIVTRHASVELPQGSTEIVFDHLPVELVDQSVQASGAGAAGATILDVTIGRSFVDYTPNDRVKAIEDELAALQSEFRKLDDRAATIVKQRDFVEKMIGASTGLATSTGGAASRPGLDEWKQLFDFTEQTFGRLAADSREIDLQRAALELTKSAKDKQLADLRGAGSRAYKTVTVRISAALAGSLDMTLKYSVPGASWAPAYDARLRSAEHAIDLTYYGVVRQNTGEDWKNVSLTLSTARPALGGVAPQPRPWLVTLYNNKSGPPMLSVGSGDKLKLDLADTPVAYSVINSEFMQTLGMTNLVDAGSWATGKTFTTVATAQMEAGLTSAVFKIAAPVSLASNNDAQKVAITTARLDAAIEYQSTPKIIEAAFLVASITNQTDVPLLAGTLNTFLDDSFVASSGTRTVMPGEKFDLSFGADEGISVKRKLVNRFTEDTGLTSHGARVTYDTVITLTNHKKTAEKLTFRESMPVARDEKIVVKQLAPAERDLGTADRPRDVTRNADGVLVWKVTLQPGEQRDIPIKVSVEHPAEIAVAGLE